MNYKEQEADILKVLRRYSARIGGKRVAVISKEQIRRASKIETKSSIYRVIKRLERNKRIKVHREWGHTSYYTFCKR